MFQDGGNVFDAAVASVAALNIVEPTSTGTGGDAFALYRTADDKIGGIRSCGYAQTEAIIKAVRERIAADDDDPTGVSMPERSPHTVTVPGAARGWETTVESLGELPFKTVLQPAIRYATD